MVVKTKQPETQTALVRRARKINRVLAETYPDAHIELDFQNPFQLVVATVLSAQTTDKRVNLTTPALFAKYPTPEDLAAANPEDVEEILKPTGFFRAKTKSVMGLSAELRDRFGGEVPRKLEDMVTLPGVGRKTANVVLGNAYGIPGITVDTHFGRLSRRFGWTSSDDPVKVEADVGALFPKSEWVMLSHRLIWHGRRICHCPQARLRRLPGGRLVPVVRAGPHGCGDRRRSWSRMARSRDDERSSYHCPFLAGRPRRCRGGDGRAERHAPARVRRPSVRRASPFRRWPRPAPHPAQ